MSGDTSGIYFFHIPKTAGTSVYNALDAAFDASEICPCWLWDSLIDMPPEELARYRVFRGHLYGYLEPFLGRELKKFVILREPIDRTISYYYYIRNLAEHPNYSDAQSLTLREFCVSEKTRYLVENYQAGYLASFRYYQDPRSLVKRFTAEERRRHLFQAALEPKTHGLPPSALLDAALEGLSRFGAIGIFESMERSSHEISRLIGRSLTLPVDPQNITSGRITIDQLDSSTFETIKTATAVDEVIYCRAAARYSGNIGTGLEGTDNVKKGEG